jgi:hypothetical protein
MYLNMFEICGPEQRKYSLRMRTYDDKTREQSINMRKDIHFDVDKSIEWIKTYNNMVYI